MMPEDEARLGSIFDEVIEVRKRLGYIRESLKRGDTFTAGEDLELAQLALNQASLDLTTLMGPAMKEEQES